ncbi:hypothetical protein SAMN04487910_2670 [Aquimarina amphilecti]|uniref:DUF3108 domain-containing protein n=1 Tax=Aquimarina amphilecti TaxID=1038014 RepID=A0A1H7QSB8_AQUAM|nr:hypothetical protein [Aquimarina amphilecti]SEL50881.1 hypothetical protein SAMN04487910_2670 [Aquimarina amphilecti]
MKKIICLLLFILGASTQVTSQEIPLNPQNNPADMNLLESGTSKMSWFMVKDSIEIKIGDVHTEIRKEKDSISIITTIVMKQSPSKWVDSTVIRTHNFEPIYHSSFNQQRDMVLKFDKKITGYYLDKQTSTKTQISEEADKPFFDSNFYPQLIRLLPLKDGYSNTISIFDYSPKSKIGVITATIKNTEKSTTEYNGELKKVWKVETTDEISDNSATSTYYIDMSTREILKQEIDFGGRKMIMKLVE